jgi:hypothetical protein
MVSARPDSLYSCLLYCDERERLATIYLAAVYRNNEAASVMANAFRDDWPQEWRLEMKTINAACQTALRELDQHLSEHGC